MKKVVPALVPDTTYDGLAIQDGDAAMSEFARMARGEIVDLAQTREDLLEYCKQDTLVMVRLHQALTRLAGRGPRAERQGRERETNRSKENGEGVSATPDRERSTESTAERPAAGAAPPQSESAEGTEREKIKKEIGKARKELLDLSLRNPLLNFRESKSRGIRIVGRTAKEVFSTLVRKRRAMTVTAQEEEAAPETSVATKRKPESAGRKRSGQPARRTRKVCLRWTPWLVPANASSFRSGTSYRPLVLDRIACAGSTSAAGSGELRSSRTSATVSGIRISKGSLFPDCHGVEPHDIWPLGQDFRVAVSGQDSLVSVSRNLTP